VFGVCTDDDDQAGCLPACREPTSKEYGCPGTLDSGHLCLNERTCATSDELPTGDPLQPQYCWEKRDRVDLEEGTFWPRTESEETTIISVQKFPGSNCYWVTANYYGIWYGWWQCV
jgi:hypothetical protein